MSEEQLGDVAWDDFYEAVVGRDPRDFVVAAMDCFERPGLAVDLGCGDGTETRLLLERGWRVLAIDAEPSAIQRTTTRAGELVDGLQTRVEGFEELSPLPSADLIVAPFTLPFCPPDSFSTMWRTVRDGLAPGGRLAVNFFGPNDTWAGSPGMTFLDRNAVEALFEGLVVESFDEVDEWGEAASGPKHWHVFTVRARR